jgi:hypothetical protein
MEDGYHTGRMNSIVQIMFNAKKKKTGRKPGSGLASRKIVGPDCRLVHAVSSFHRTTHLSTSTFRI